MGAMSSEMKSAKWFWSGIAFQCATGFSVSFVVYQLGTLITTGSLGNGFVYGLVAIAVFALYGVTDDLAEMLKTYNFKIPV